MSKRHVIRINQGRIISLWLRIIIVIFLLTGMMIVNLMMDETYAVFLSICFATPVLPIWNAFRLLEVDARSRAYYKGYWLAGIKWGDWHSYEAIQEVRVLGPGEGQSAKTNKRFKAFLILKNGEQIYLIGHNSRDKLEDHLKKIHEKLNLDKSN